MEPFLFEDKGWASVFLDTVSDIRVEAPEVGPRL